MTTAITTAAGVCPSAIWGGNWIAITKVATAAIYAGQVVCFDASNAKGQAYVKPAPIAVTTGAWLPIGVALADCASGGQCTVAVSGVVNVINGYSDVDIAVGKPVKVGAYIGSVLLASSAADSIIGIALDSILQGSYGRIVLSRGFY